MQRVHHHQDRSASPLLLEGQLTDRIKTIGGRLHIAPEHGYGMNPNKGQFRLGLTAPVPLAQLLDEGVARARGKGAISTASPDRTDPSKIYCVLIRILQLMLVRRIMEISVPQRTSSGSSLIQNRVEDAEH